jgi:hypothetical protein
MPYVSALHNIVEVEVEVHKNRERERESCIVVSGFIQDYFFFTTFFSWIQDLED